MLALALAALSQPGGRGGAPAAAPLHQVVEQVFDTDKDGKVTLSEITTTLDGLAAISGMGMAGGAGGAGGGGDAASEMAAKIRAAKRFAPQLIKLMDVDSSGTLSRSELKWLSQAHKRMKSSLKDLAQGVFDAIDADADDSLSPQEQTAALSQPVLGAVVGLLETDPIKPPALSASIEEAATAENLRAAVALLDGDGDGSVSRKEAYRAVAAFKKQFLEAATLLETMGPMLAMFGGAARGGGGGGRGRGRGGSGGASGGAGPKKVVKPKYKAEL